MLTMEDCLGLCELTEDEVKAIAEHEHLTEIVAAELGNYLVHSPDGVPRISAMIRDDIEQAAARGNGNRVLQLKLVLRHFIETHPTPEPGATRQAAG